MTEVGRSVHTNVYEVMHDAALEPVGLYSADSGPSPEG